MDIKQIILKKIGKMGYAFSELSVREVEYLFKIEAVISEIFNREERARELLTNNHLSINSISTKSNIARQTLYNNRILIEYIEFRSMEFKNIDMSLSTTELQEKIKSLTFQVNEMMKRDSEFEEMKIEVNVLKSKLKDKEQELLRLSKPLNSKEHN